LLAQRWSFLNGYGIVVARTFLQLPRLDKISCNNRHVDRRSEHVVCLYYVNDSDGDTVLFNGDTEEVIQRVTPKRGRVVLFDGGTYHASGKPTVNCRAVINLNLVRKNDC